jgi:hypothetical protein
VASTERRPNAFRLLIDLIDRPGRTIATIAVQPRWAWVLPVVVTIAFAVVAIVVTLPYATASPQGEIQRQLAALPAQQAEMVTAQLDRLQQPAVMLSIGIGSRLLWMLISWLFAAVILYFCILLFGADVGFGGLIAAVLWTWLPLSLRDIVQSAYVFVRGQPIANQGLSYVVSTGIPANDATNYIYAVLAQVDLFALWHVILVLALLITVARFSKGKAFFLALVYAALNLGLRLIPALLGRSFNLA